MYLTICIRIYLYWPLIVSDICTCFPTLMIFSKPHITHNHPPNILHCSFFSQPRRLQQFIDDLKSGKLHREFHHGPDPVCYILVCLSPYIISDCLSCACRYRQQNRLLKKKKRRKILKSKKNQLVEKPENLNLVNGRQKKLLHHIMTMRVHLRANLKRLDRVGIVTRCYVTNFSANVVSISLLISAGTVGNRSGLN